jgi:hypothetical protein
MVIAFESALQALIGQFKNSGGDTWQIFSSKKSYSKRHNFMSKVFGILKWI